MKKLNWNCSVKVKLTDFGKNIYYHRFDRLIEGGADINRLEPREDENGYCSFQLWDFMHLYGGYIGMCLPEVVETINFYIDEKDLDDAEDESNES